MQNRDSITIVPEQLPAPSLKDCVYHLVIAIASSRNIWVLATLDRLASSPINHMLHSKKDLQIYLLPMMVRIK